MLQCSLIDKSAWIPKDPTRPIHLNNVSKEAHKEAAD
jgi:hypothetical protein